MSEAKSEEYLLNKEIKLKEFNEQLKKQNEEFKKNKSDFESYKKVELEKLSKERNKEFDLFKKVEIEKLNQELSKERNKFRENLEKEKTKELQSHNENLTIEFKKKSEEYNISLSDLTKNELELTEENSKLNRERDSFTQEKKTFDSEKSKLLAEYKQSIEEVKTIFINTQEEKKVQKLEEINKKIKELYSDKENEIAKKGQENKTLEANLNIKEAELNAKEKSLESLRLYVYEEEKEKVNEEVKSLNEKLNHFEKTNSNLREELTNKVEELDIFEKFEDRNLPIELEEKQKELTRINKLLEDNIDIKNNLLLQKQKQSIDFENEKYSLLNEKEGLLSEVLEVESLKSDKVLLETKLESKENLATLLEGEKKELQERLNLIYSDGTELEERIKDIQQKPYKNINLKEISESKPKDEIKFLTDIETNMKSYGITYPKRLLYAFHTALKCADFSPLAVLSGVSGTGKSELPKLYSHFGGFNFLAEAVQPTWDSPSSMLGFYNTIDRKFDSTNILKFLIQTSQSRDENDFGLKESMNLILLDEMNLAHIELYFAEFLSKFEQRRGSKGVNLDIQLGTGMNYELPLDNNVLWIGTMNEDETTKSLSDKVLDRAFSINFPRPISLKSRKKLEQLSEVKQFEYLSRNTWDSWIQKESIFVGDNEEVIKEYQDLSNSLNEFLAPTGRAIGHRVWQSIEFYLSNHPLVIQNKDKNTDTEFKRHVKRSFEEQLVQKVMPKLRGIEVNGKEKEALLNIKQLLIKAELNLVEDFELAMDNPYGQFIWNSANYLEEK